MASRPTIVEQCIRLYSRNSGFKLLYKFFKESSGGSDVPSPVELARSLRANIDHFFVEDNILYYQPSVDDPRRICVQDDTDLRNATFYEYHDTATSGHSGYLKPLLAVQTTFY
ncbi:hypothetical protein GN244_ATG05974 [Phytophthora infestans]|uniref:Integrase zinc-binding domain-containing protein n=1 Tax=Phytophthora infestans TaxID=4787 RepID=A0A833TF57_PHYIN|nr:hypothetical protein GN244_ATG05974 [Phytophthora infestans]KAF4149089.1 hypothetical protein GN958_ATG01717 [Phytophthora infestans]